MNGLKSNSFDYIAHNNSAFERYSLHQVSVVVGLCKLGIQDVEDKRWIHLSA